MDRLIAILPSCLESGSSGQDDEPDEEPEGESEAEDVGNLDNLLERANEELGSAIPVPGRNAGKNGFLYLSG
jgi:hypothetical protein